MTPRLEISAIAVAKWYTFKAAARVRNVDEAHVARVNYPIAKARGGSHD